MQITDSNDIPVKLGVLRNKRHGRVSDRCCLEALSTTTATDMGILEKLIYSGN